MHALEIITGIFLFIVVGLCIGKYDYEKKYEQ